MKRLLVADRFRLHRGPLTTPRCRHWIARFV